MNSVVPGERSEGQGHTWQPTEMPQIWVPAVAGNDKENSGHSVSPRLEVDNSCR
jgi:hypothetical protein